MYNFFFYNQIFIILTIAIFKITKFSIEIPKNSKTKLKTIQKCQWLFVSRIFDKYSNNKRTLFFLSVKINIIIGTRGFLYLIYLKEYLVYSYEYFKCPSNNCAVFIISVICFFFFLTKNYCIDFLLWNW